MNGKTLIITAIVLQAILILGMCFGPGIQKAQAQIPDPGAQRAQTIQLLTAQNDKLDKIIALLDGGNIQVRVAKAEEKAQ